MRGDPLSRQWRLMKAIAASSNGISVGELAQQEEVEPRTVYRDLEVLQEAGFPIFPERQGRSQRWRMMDTTRSSKQQVPAPYNMGELIALWLARELLKALPRSPLAPALDDLFQKLVSTLSTTSRLQMEKIQTALKMESRTQESVEAGQKILGKIAQAVSEKKKIQVVYRQTPSSPQTVHLLEPYRIWHFAGLWYLLAHCSKQDRVQVWALSRMQILNLTDEPSRLKVKFDLNDLLRQACRMVHDDFYSLRLVLDPSWRDLLGAGNMAEIAASNIRQLADGAMEMDLQLSYLPADNPSSKPSGSGKKTI